MTGARDPWPMGERKTRSARKRSVRSAGKAMRSRNDLAGTVKGWISS